MVEIQAGNGKEGLKTVVSELHDPAAPVPGSESELLEQMDMLALPLNDTTPEARALEVRRGRGRPVGAKNKNTEAWRNFILSRYSSPLEALAQTFNISIPDLAARLGLKNPPTFDQALELLKVQMAAARDLAPYVHQKMPQAIEAGEGGLIQLVLNTGGAFAQAGAQAVPQAIKILNSEPEENQLVTDADFTDSNESDSNEERQANDE